VLLGALLFGAVLLGAEFEAVGPPVRPVGDAPPEGAVVAPPLGPDVTDAALLGPPVTLPEPLGDMTGTAPDALTLPLLAPPGSEGLPAVELDVFEDGPALVEECELWTA